MGKYCKAYPVERFEAFNGWEQKAKSPVRISSADDSDDSEASTIGDYLYLHDNYTVTDGIFDNEGIVYDDVNPEWIAFCKDKLKFEAPA